jgi:hypothetical protein
VQEEGLYDSLRGVQRARNHGHNTVPQELQHAWMALPSAWQRLLSRNPALLAAALDSGCTAILEIQILFHSTSDRLIALPLVAGAGFETRGLWVLTMPPGGSRPEEAPSRRGREVLPSAGPGMRRSVHRLWGA